MKIKKKKITQLYFNTVVSFCFIYSSASKHSKHLKLLALTLARLTNVALAKLNGVPEQ